jgi:putative flippase GtrA
MNALRVATHANVGSRSRSLLQRLTRCMSVSVVTTVISLFTLATATAAFGVTAWIANVIATTVATIPSYYLNRRWTWGRTGASDPWREVLPFWALAFAGLALSTISVALTDAWSVGAHLAPPVHTMTLLVAHLSGFGVLWVAQFILLDRILFRPRRAQHDPFTAASRSRRPHRSVSSREFASCQRFSAGSASP